MYQDNILVRHLGLQPYEPVSQAMHDFTDSRDDTTPDEIWLVEHLPVFTQGQAGKAEHLLFPGEIPVPAFEVGQAYVKAIHGAHTGQTIRVGYVPGGK